MTDGAVSDRLWRIKLKAHMSERILPRSAELPAFHFLVFD